MVEDKTSKKVLETTVRRALEVQEIYLLHKRKDLPNIWIYRHHIKPNFHISERTFYRYLGINAKKLVKQFE